ncbi:MAG: flagellar basal body rod protein FlgB [Ignavibacteriales bacterium]
MSSGTGSLLGSVVNDPTMTLIERGLDLASVRHAALSNNIANVNTPGYKRRDVPFEDVMREVASGGYEGTSGAAGLERVVTVNTGRTNRNDGNNVDIDYEMTVLAQNSVLYNALARQISQKISLLRTVITEGRR